MAKPSSQDWTQELKTGVLEVTGLDTISKMGCESFLAVLQSSFPIRFLEGHTKNKTEVGLAQKRRGHRYVRCVVLTFEFDRLTSLASMTYLRIRRSPTDPDDQELASGAGFNVFHDVDGWKIKLLEERRIAIRDASLRKRGWRLIG